MSTTPFNLNVSTGNAIVPTRTQQNPVDGSVASQVVLEVQGVATSLTNGQPVQEVPTAFTNSASGTMGTTAAIVVPYSSTRKTLWIFSRTSGSEVQDLGSSNVAVGGGIPLFSGNGFFFGGPGAAGPIYGVTTVGSSPYSYVEA